ncbi:MAG: hypothetical protein F4060_17680 [Holophagales bacterium]|nr:hypothetical protein [Holophagales bacterium]MYI81751.1 hypothetical protein [Holophagales bacterium]
MATTVSVAPPVAAVTYVLPSDESMVDRTPVIVFGRVLSAAPAPDVLRLPSTDFTVEVEEVLKGAVAGSTIVVRQLGGVRADGLAMRVGGLPILQQGERMLLFLSERDGVLRTVEFALGMFFEVRVQGRTLLEREPSLREDVLGLGRDDGVGRREALLGPRDAEAFRRWIRDRAAGAERSADYFVPENEVVRGPAAVVSPYRFLRTNEDCAGKSWRYTNWTLRWVEFERGESVAFSIQRGGQPGLTEASTRLAVSDAMRAWNSDPQSRVNLQYYRDPVEPEVNEYRGRNLIMFDDPFDERGELEAEGGTIGWAYNRWWCNRPPVPRAPPYDQDSDIPIIQSDINTRRGLDDWLRRRYASERQRRVFIEELLGHELGHSLGLAHPCGDDASGECDTPAKDEALMRANLHGDDRGARLSPDDREILRILYPLPSSGSAPRAPTDLKVTPIDSTTARVTWKDRSQDEDGFALRIRLEGTVWQSIKRTQANVEEGYAHGLRPGGRYDFLVRAWRGNFYADSDPVAATMPTDTPKPGGLQSSQFGVDFTARANGSTVVGRAAAWSSDKGVLYWLFDSQNPEALAKVLDGRSVNGHWWLDLAVTSDLRSVTRATHRGTGDEWVAITGLGRDVFSEPGETANRLVHCAFPAKRPDNDCAVSGYGTTVSLRDAWDASGRIPSSYFVPPASVSTAEGHVVAGSPARLFGRGVSGVVAAASTLHSSQFGVNFTARANGSTTVGRSAGWSSEKGVLYWLFDSENPEALVKVLDGRRTNGHWWLDLAVTSDLRTITRVTHRGTGDEWVAITGLGRDVFTDPGDTADRLVHCAYPASRADDRCAFWGYGTTISLRDAWDSSGHIPSAHYD